MRFIFVISFSILIFESIICDDAADNKMYPSASNPAQAEPNYPSIAMPSQGVLGVDKLYTPYTWPTPAISPIGITNMFTLSNSTCSANSAIRGCFINSTIKYPFTCNGLQANILKHVSTVSLDGYSQSLCIPRLHQNSVYLNGNFIQLAAGVITQPPRCAGGIIFEVVIYLANSQYQCVTSGVNGHKIIYQLKLITGNCQSTCWLWSGNTLLNPTVNNLGAVVEPEPEHEPEPEAERPAPERPNYPKPEKPHPEWPTAEKPYPEKPYPERPAPERPNPERPYPEKPYPEKPYQNGPRPEKPYPERPYQERPNPEKPYPERPVQSYPEKPYQPSPEKPYQPFPEKPYQPIPERPYQPYPEKPYQPHQPYPHQPYPERPQQSQRPNPQSYPELPQYGGQGIYQGNGNGNGHQPNFGKPYNMREGPFEGESYPGLLPGTGANQQEDDPFINGNQFPELPFESY